MTRTQTQSGCFTGLFGLLFRPPPAQPEFPYAMVESVLTKTELTFYKVLCQAVQQRAIILSKVRLADIFNVTVQQSSYTYFSRIAMKHVDFLLCELDTFEPLCGIELDDPTHNRDDRNERDIFVNGVFDAAGLALVHIKTRKTYDLDQLTVQLDPYLGASFRSLNSARAVSKRADRAPTAGPACPSCGAQMLFHKGRLTKYRGRPYYACPNGNCRETVSATLTTGFIQEP